MTRTGAAHPDMTTGTAKPRRAAGATLVGTVLEWYDFTLYGQAAALVFAGQFFSSSSSGIFAALATYAVGYVARPLGGIIFGHIGDRVGRKPALMITLLMMGIATGGIGLLPTYDQIGLWAPALLVLLRLVQGAGAGAEYAGAVLMSAEHAPGKRRGIFASVPSIGYFGGVVLATALFEVAAQMPERQFQSWGWRVLFLVSLLIVVVGVWMRLRVPETPEFARTAAERRRARMPVVEVVRGYGRALGIAAGANLGQYVCSTIIQVWVITYATATLHIPKATILAGVLCGAILALVTVPLFATLSDRIGRRPVHLGASLFTAAYAFPFFWLLHSDSAFLQASSVAVGVATGIAAWFGVLPALMVELFSPTVRFTGITVAREGTSVIFGGTAPLVAAWLAAQAGGGSWPVACYMMVAALVSGVIVFMATGRR